MPYRVPLHTQRTETVVVNSRFITHAMRVESTDAVRAALDEVRVRLPDASHHVYAFRVGFGNSVIEGMSDAGEPTGTAGPPVLAVVRGSGIGDILVVVTRYFGGTLLGTGGLVRAYGDAARAALEQLPTELKISKERVALETPYPFYELIRRALPDYDAVVDEEDFAINVDLFITMPTANVERFIAFIRDLTHGQVVPFILED